MIGVLLNLIKKLEFYFVARVFLREQLWYWSFLWETRKFLLRAQVSLWRNVFVCLCFSKHKWNCEENYIASLRLTTYLCFHLVHIELISSGKELCNLIADVYSNC